MMMMMRGRKTHRQFYKILLLCARQDEDWILRKADDGREREIWVSMEILKKDVDKDDKRWWGWKEKAK